jgi:hypothetical protein
MQSKKLLLVTSTCLMVAALLYAGQHYYYRYDTGKKEQVFSSTAIPAYMELQLKQLSEIFDNSERLLMTGVVQVSDADSSTQLEESSFRFIKEGSDIYSSLANTEEIKSNNTLVFVDHDNKMVIAYPDTKDAPAEMNQNFFSMYKRLLEQDYTIKETTEKQQRKLRFYAYPAAEKPTFEMSYDTITMRPYYFSTLNYGNSDPNTTKALEVKMVIRELRKPGANEPRDKGFDLVKWNEASVLLPATLHQYQIHYVK